MNEAGREARAQQDGSPKEGREGPGETVTPAAGVATGEVRRQLDRAPAERYREAPASAATVPTRRRRLLAPAGVAGVTALVTFLLTYVDIGPGLLVIAVVGGWLTGLAASGGAPAGRGDDAGTRRAATAAVLAGAGLALGLLLAGLSAYPLGGVLLPWEYDLARFGVVAPLAVVLAAAAGWLRGH